LLKLTEPFERLNFSITDSAIVIADVGDSLFGSLDLTIRGQTDFLSPAYYCSMGFAVPAAHRRRLGLMDHYHQYLYQYIICKSFPKAS
jgi:indolepyruvate decarboxylase